MLTKKFRCKFVVTSRIPAGSVKKPDTFSRKVSENFTLDDCWDFDLTTGGPEILNSFGDDKQFAEERRSGLATLA